MAERESHKKTRAERGAAVEDRVPDSGGAGEHEDGGGDRADEPGWAGQTGTAEASARAVPRPDRKGEDAGGPGEKRPGGSAGSDSNRPPRPDSVPPAAFAADPDDGAEGIEDAEPQSSPPSAPRPVPAERAHELTSSPPTPPDATTSTLRPSAKPSVPPPERLQDTPAEAADGSPRALPPPKAPPRPLALRQPSSGLVPQLVALVMLIGLPYYAIVWRDLLAGMTPAAKGSVTLAALAGVAMVFALTRPYAERFYRIIGETVILGTLATGAAAVAVLFSEATQAQFARLFGVVLLSVLPAWLYHAFISARGRTFWDDYVLNLYRLRADEFPNLPAPPIRSVFTQEREQATRARRGMNGGVDERSRPPSVYEKKYTALFGPVPDGSHESFSMLRGENLSPVALATLAFSVGWVVVLRPESALGLEVFADPALGAPLGLPMESLGFAFMGAYAYSLQSLVRRYFQSDLRTGAYLYAILRVVVVLLVVWALEFVLPDTMGQAPRTALAFVIGVFPDVGWRVIVSVVSWPAKMMLPSLRSEFPLSDLDGLNLWYEARLLEEGIEDMQNLATADLVEVMLNSRIPVPRLVDWVDQALLYLRVGNGPGAGGETDRKKLRRYGIRCMTDLSEALGPNPEASELKSLLDRPGDAGHVLLAVMRSAQGEPNLHHVQAYKRHARKYLSGERPALA